MKKLLTLTIITIFATLCSINAEAQNSSHNYGIELNGGIMEYQGDLGSALFFSRRPDYQGLGLSFGRYINPTFDVIANIGVGDLGYYATTDWLPEPEKFSGFRARVINGQLGVRIKLANDIIIPSSALIQPYLQATFGGVNIYSRIVNVPRNYTEILNSIAAGGGGVNLNFSESFSMRVQTMFNYTFNDVFDGFPYSNGVHKRNKNSDAFMYHSIGFVYHFGAGSGGDGIKKLKDSDNDGVPNKYDKCKNTREGYLVDSVGCDLDTDMDGIPDTEDKCPKIKGTAEHFGCPAIDSAAEAKIQAAAQGIYFETASATIKESSYQNLDNLAKLLEMYQDANIAIEGHTDSDGDDASNLKLSQERADAVRTYLIKKGVDGNRMTSTGYGETKPIASNDTAEGKAKNRRVYFKLTYDEATK